MKTIKSKLSKLICVVIVAMFAMSSFSGCEFLLGMLDTETDTYDKENIRTAVNNSYESLFGYVREEEASEQEDTNTPQANSNNPIVAYAKTKKIDENPSIKAYDSLLQPASSQMIDEVLAFNDGESAMYLNMAAYFYRQDDYEFGVWHDSDVSAFWGNRHMMIRASYDKKYIYTDFVVDDLSTADYQSDIVIQIRLEYDFESGDFHYVVYYAHTDGDIHDEKVKIKECSKRYEYIYRSNAIESMCYTSYGARGDSMYVIAADTVTQTAYDAPLEEGSANYNIAANLLSEYWQNSDWVKFTKKINNYLQDDHMKNYVRVVQSRSDYLNEIENAKTLLKNLPEVDSLPDCSYKTYFQGIREEVIEEAKNLIAKYEDKYFAWEMKSDYDLTNYGNSDVYYCGLKAEGEFVWVDVNNGEVVNESSSSYLYTFLVKDENGNYKFIEELPTYYYTDFECTTPITWDDVKNYDFENGKFYS